MRSVTIPTPIDPKEVLKRQAWVVAAIEQSDPARMPMPSGGTPTPIAITDSSTCIQDFGADFHRIYDPPVLKPANDNKPPKANIAGLRSTSDSDAPMAIVTNGMHSFIVKNTGNSAVLFGSASGITYSVIGADDIAVTSYDLRLSPTGRLGTLVSGEFQLDRQWFQFHRSTERDTSRMFLDSIYARADAKEFHRGALEIFAKLDSLMKAGDFPECNQILATADIPRLKSEDLILSFLTITCAADRAILPSRANFFQKAKAAIESTDGKQYADQLFDGLE
jgi:hypothetical protein